jgi:hypothetical protein
VFRVVTPRLEEPEPEQEEDKAATGEEEKPEINEERPG